MDWFNHYFRYNGHILSIRRVSNAQFFWDCFRSDVNWLAVAVILAFLYRLRLLGVWWWSDWSWVFYVVFTLAWALTRAAVRTRAYSRRPKPDAFHVEADGSTFELILMEEPTT